MLDKNAIDLRDKGIKDGCKRWLHQHPAHREQHRILYEAYARLEHAPFERRWAATKAVNRFNKQIMDDMDGVQWVQATCLDSEMDSDIFVQKVFRELLREVAKEWYGGAG